VPSEDSEVPNEEFIVAVRTENSPASGITENASPLSSNLNIHERQLNESTIDKTVSVNPCEDLAD
jgi:hypothetical protein